MELEIVSCIMPTKNRDCFLQMAVKSFLKQDYPNIELIVIDGSDRPTQVKLPRLRKIKYFYLGPEKTIGACRNFGCGEARGKIIVHLDDDDIYASDWVSKIVNTLCHSDSDICGLSNLSLYDVRTAKLWRYNHPLESPPWIYGATFAYKKSFWQKHRFLEYQAGEDNEFLIRSDAVINTVNYSQGYMAIIHDQNIGMHPFDNPREKIAVFKWMKTVTRIFPPNILPCAKANYWCPRVSCIMPTANRRKFITNAITNFQLQDYSNKELLIIDDGTDKIQDLVSNSHNIKYIKLPLKQTIGTKRNIGCDEASGDIIIHWDDDDWYASNWLSHQVHCLIDNGVDICGLDQVQFYSVIDNKFWMTKNYNSRKLWLSGATLAYRRSFWEKYPFKDIQIGEDDAFIRNPKAKVKAHDYYQGFIALIHTKNTSIKVFQK